MKIFSKKPERIEREKPKPEPRDRPPTIEEVNEDLQRHKRHTAERFEENDSRLKAATDSLRERLNHLHALIDVREAKSKKEVG